jgi:nucleoid-associated protein YgaU
MGNGAKIALVGVLAMIVAVVAAWDRTNEKKHEEGLDGLPSRPIERPADPPRVRVAPQPAAPENHVTGEMTHGLALGAPPLNREGKTPRVASSALLASASGAAGSRPGGKDEAPVAGTSPGADPDARNLRPQASKKTHTITKSDTLSKLAEAEYGAKKLWRRIYDANRGVIRNPDSLPVGKEIVIPPAPGAQVASAREPQATTVRPSLSAVTEVTTLPAGAADGATYEVVAGDTLGKIALKTLGSKDRWHLIADANKDLLKGGTAVRIGQKLVIPAKPKTNASR